MRTDFPEKVKKAARKRAAGKCERCGIKTGPHNPAEVHHSKEDWAGGKPILENAVVLGAKCCHKKLTADGTKRRSKADAQRKSYLGEKPKSRLSAPRVRREIAPRDDEAHVRRLSNRHAEHLQKMMNKTIGRPV